MGRREDRERRLFGLNSNQTSHVVADLVPFFLAQCEEEIGVEDKEEEGL